ncbi:MAG TPA: glycosyltransferase family 2 protein [Gaiellaceae bacterium]|jgi:cellulose synthase/poly-beta-1,6-N-acetylglucosamine synthase-like glycosyltransferase
MLARRLFWASAGALAWTHVGYPLAARWLAERRGRPVRKAPQTPRVAVVVAAHNEDDVIERRLENLLALDYPAESLEILVASDASTDRTDELVEAAAGRDPRVRLVRCPRGGKVAAQNHTVRETDAEILAFSDANARWAPETLRKLVESFADPEVAYVCGQLRLDSPDGTNREGAYWRYEVALRSSESLLGSVTGGNGSVYAVRREDYVDVDPRFGHDLAFPYLMVQRGRRAVYEPEAIAFERPTPDTEDEYRRKVRMFEHCWAIVLEGRMFRDVPPLYLGQLVSHRALRYGSGLLHVILLATTLRLAPRGGVYRLALAKHVAFLALAEAGRRRKPMPGASLAWYYTLVTAATLVALAGYLRRGVPAVWDRPEGTR